MTPTTSVQTATLKATWRRAGITSPPLMRMSEGTRTNTAALHHPRRDGGAKSRRDFQRLTSAHAARMAQTDPARMAPAILGVHEVAIDLMTWTRKSTASQGQARVRMSSVAE